MTYEEAMLDQRQWEEDNFSPENINYPNDEDDDEDEPIDESEEEE